MSMSDPLSDMLTRIRNALRNRQNSCLVLKSKLHARVLDVLVREGFIRSVSQPDAEPSNRYLTVELKYSDGQPAIKEITRVSKPSRRVYSPIKGLPRVYAGLGISVLSTPAGVLSDVEARSANVGGEVLCKVF